MKKKKLRPVNQMSFFDVRDELYSTKNKNTPRAKELQKRVKEVQKAYAAWSRRTPLHINKI